MSTLTRSSPCKLYQASRTKSATTCRSLKAQQKRYDDAMSRAMWDTAPMVADAALDLLRERHRRVTVEFHLQRALHDLANHLHSIELRASFLALQADADPMLLDELMQS